MNSRRKGKARRRHVDSSDDDDDPLYDTYLDENGMTRSKPLPTAEFPRYSLPSVERPPPLPSIKPDTCRQAQKEMLQMLSGLFSWELFMNGKKKAKCEFQPEFVEAAKVRKLESSWKQSVTRRAALSIEEAVRNKDLNNVYQELLRRQQMMESERSKAHTLRVQRHLPRELSKHEGRHFSHTPEERSRTSMGVGSRSSQPSQLPPRATTSMHSNHEGDLLLLNDDMLLQEANLLLVQATKGKVPPCDALAAHATLRHRSLTPLKDTLQAPSQQPHTRHV